MFDKEAIEAIQEGAGIYQAKHAVLDALKVEGAVALPEDYKVRDLEDFMPKRRRMRGLFKTNVIADFAAYVTTNKEAGAAVFVSADDMRDLSAWAILNMGTPAAPGHTDNRAKLLLRMTAAYLALRGHTSNGCISQVKAVEFVEDWSDCIECFKDAEKLTNAKAIAALRRITIDSYRKQETVEKSHSASKSAFESVTVNEFESLPTHIYFTCVPFQELAKRTFVLRVGVQTSGDKPSISLRVINEELHAEEMSQEFAGLVRDALKDVPVGVGFYESK